MLRISSKFVLEVRNWVWTHDHSIAVAVTRHFNPLEHVIVAVYVQHYYACVKQFHISFSVLLYVLPSAN